MSIVDIANMFLRVITFCVKRRHSFSLEGLS